MEINEAALEAASRHIYEDKGDRKGVLYVGWDHEPEKIKKQWREDVRVSVEAYLRACQ
jgi:hypothetical protein